MSAREIMGSAILDAGKNMGTLAYRAGKTFEDKIVSLQIAALTAAGYRILAPGELDQETVEACATLIEEGYDRLPGKVFRKDGVPSKHDQCAHGAYEYEDCEACAATAIRSLGRRA